MTAGLVKVKLEEFDLLDKTEIHTVEAGEIIELGKFSVEFIHINHSIADAVSFAIKTPLGTVIHTGDFKIDPTPIKGSMIDLARFGQLGKEGVLALLADSTNVERPGYSASESKVGESFDALFKGCTSRIYCHNLRFRNVDRIQQVINIAARYGRKVAVTGRSNGVDILRVSTELGYNGNTREHLSGHGPEPKSLPKDKVVIITTRQPG
jgi:ribonuclease J